MSTKTKSKAKQNSRTPKSEEEKNQLFFDEYKKLCEKYGLRINAVPGWRFSSDGNDFRMVINLVVAQLEAG